MNKKKDGGENVRILHHLGGNINSPFIQTHYKSSRLEISGTIHKTNSLQPN